MISQSTHLQRFGDAMEALCDSRPPDDLLTDWLNHSSDDLQQFACIHTKLSWAQGIVVIEAALLLAGSPVEGEEHLPG